MQVVSVLKTLPRVARVLTLAMLAGLWAATSAAQDLPRLSEIVEDWLGAPHGDYHALSFTYWNTDGAVPVQCAACHSEPGFIDFLGADGSTPGVVDKPAPVQSPIGCASCHTDTAHALDSVAFPSGVTVDGLAASATCSVCHQGRQSSDSVTAAVAGKEADAVSADLGFLNIHYGPAAAVLKGSEVRGGFQYPGKRYAGRFAHAPGASTCVDCHEPHTTEVATEGCFSCHQGVERLTDIRTQHRDFDGDGNRDGGIQGEIEALHRLLGAAIDAYAADIAGAPIVYADRFPYFFVDRDGEDGDLERYANWTPRLLMAAYNYQVVAKDAGGYVHNPAYMLQLLYDSLESLSDRVEIDMSRMARP